MFVCVKILPDADIDNVVTAINGASANTCNVTVIATVHKCNCMKVHATECQCSHTNTVNIL